MIRKEKRIRKTCINSEFHQFGGLRLYRTMESHTLPALQHPDIHQVHHIAQTKQNILRCKEAANLLRTLTGCSQS